MASLKATLSLSSAAGQVSSDALSFSVTDTATVKAPIVNMSKITATTTGGDTVILPSTSTTRYVYIKHLGLNSAGGSSGADQVKVELADNTRVIDLSKDEFCFLPYRAEGAGALQLEASANTVQVEYAYFTRA